MLHTMPSWMDDGYQRIIIIIKNEALIIWLLIMFYMVPRTKKSKRTPHGGHVNNFYEH